MFKKEAEKWVRENTHTEHSASFGEIKVEPSAEKGFQKGAEFGYNKANEWHYVKEGTPEELQDVLCFVIHNEHRYVLQGYLRDGRWVLSPLGTYLNNDDVIAWKEIVLPELKEIE